MVANRMKWLKIITIRDNQPHFVIYRVQQADINKNLSPCAHVMSNIGVYIFFTAAVTTSPFRNGSHLPTAHVRMCGFLGFCQATQWRRWPWKTSIRYTLKDNQWVSYVLEESSGSNFRSAPPHYSCQWNVSTPTLMMINAHALYSNACRASSFLEATQQKSINRCSYSIKYDTSEESLMTKGQGLASQNSR
jgi:hypothetical protein